MSETNEFSGLNMPVFTAFGWAGEEAAIQFALSQMEAFIALLHEKSQKQIRDLLPFYGLSKTNQNVYLSSEATPENGLNIVFNARTTSLEMQFVLLKKEVLDKAYRQISKQPVLAHRLITELGPEWSIRIQQMEYNADNETATNYQDIFKDSISQFTDDTAVTVFEKAVYLNTEEKWIVPIYISRRFEAEKIAAMGLQVVDVIAQQLAAAAPLLRFLLGQTEKKSPAKTKKTTKKRSAKASKAAAAKNKVPEPDEDGFSYTSELMPLHIRKGFVNLTPQHWPFFSINSRTETRPVTVYYDGIYDKDSAVWRMLPDDRARLVLSPKVHEWLETKFSPNDSLQLTATKIDSNEIQISLKPIDE